MFKHSLILMFALLLNMFSSMCMHARDFSSTNLHFVYIAHETTTPVNVLCEKLHILCNDVREVDDALIVYLSDGAESLVAFINMPDLNGEKRDLEVEDREFTSIIEALQDANFHRVDARVDRERLISLFSDMDFMAENSSAILYNSVTFDFYVGSSFWSLGYNEKIIGHLYCAFDMCNLSREKFSMNIFVPSSDTLVYQENFPFGDNDIDGLNKSLKILKY